MSAKSARRVAYDLITSVDENAAYANLAMPALLARAKLSPRDAGFATELGYGTLRLRGRYDAVAGLLSSRPITKLDAPVRRLLQLGAHQLFGMRVEAHAAVSQTVGLAGQVGVRSATGYINSVLRRMSEHPVEYWLERVSVAYPQRNARLAALHSHPEWVVASLESALEAAGSQEELEAMLEADNASPEVSLVSLPGLGPDLAARSAIGAPGNVSPLAIRHPGGALIGLEERGLRVQDEGSQLAALALSRLREAAPGERWLDICAGPGGKAALLAAEARQNGAALTANEVSAHRAQLVRNALTTVDPSVTVLEQDGRALSGTFERILLDAPCSGLGALRRRPEARWRKTEAELRALSVLQRELLEHSLSLLSPGGVLAYVTCSPDVRETSEVVQAALASFRGTGSAVSFRPVETAPVLDRIAGKPLNAKVGTAAQLWPHRHGTDAMFIQLIEKVGSSHGSH